MAFYNQPPEAVLRDLGSSPAGLTEAAKSAKVCCAPFSARSATE